MTPPPFLLGAALLFWGWQSGFLIAGALMALVLEGAHWFKARWEFSDDDFNRIWSFCAVLLLAAAVYAFNAFEGVTDVRNFLQDPNFLTQRNVGTATSKAAAAWLRWLPMILFLLAAAQAFSTRTGVSLDAISFILRRRRRKAQQLGRVLPPSRSVNVLYPFFGTCLFAASVHASEDATFFWGLCLLVAWALWSQRSRRFALVVWAGALALAVALGYAGQRGLTQLQHVVDNLNPQWFGRFARRGFDPTQSKTALGQIGSLKTSGTIVIRLEAKAGPPPSLLREATYRAYRSQAWYSELRADDFTVVNETPLNSGTYVLLPGQTNTATANIACYLDGRQGLLPLPAGSRHLDNLWIVTLKESSLGAVLAEGSGLAQFDVTYRGGTTSDAPGNTNEDLAIPPKEAPALDQIFSDLHLAGQSQEQKLQSIREFFLSRFSYSTWQGPGTVANTNETPLSRFLLRTHTGHCEYFATATVLLLRRAGIPARYAVGYAVHEGKGRKYVVRQRDAHAWCLAWKPGTGTWEEVDTTPGSWTELEAKQAAALQFLSDAWSRLKFEFSRLRWSKTPLRQYVLWALLPVLGLLLYRILFRSRRQRQQRKKAAPDPAMSWPGLDSEFYELEKKLAERGVTRRPSEPLSEWLQRAAAAPEPGELAASLQALLRLHYRYRFDPCGLNPAEREELRREARACWARLDAAGQAVR